MVWGGNTVYILNGYRPLTRPAYKFQHVSNGNWKLMDRGSSQDVFEADVQFIGPASEMADLESALRSNRETFTATFGNGEEIFGADVDYSGSLTVAVVKYGEMARVGFKSYSMDLKLRLPSQLCFNLGIYFKTPPVNLEYCSKYQIRYYEIFLL